nr:MAG TPA: hypothetical protein [Caudoviricetes sp.]
MVAIYARPLFSLFLSVKLGLFIVLVGTKSSVRRSGGFEIRRQKRFGLLNRGICNPPIL